MTDISQNSGVQSDAAAPFSVGAFNSYGVWAMYRFQMARFFRTLGEGLATPVITTALYFVVFGGALAASWVTTAVLLRIPPVARVIGQGPVRERGREPLLAT